MAGMAPISLQQFLNPVTGRAYAGARANFYEASTTTRIAVYSDYGLTQELPNPVKADAYGRFPAIFLDEEIEFYRLRLTSATGSVLPLGDGGSFDLPILPIIGPASGGEGEVTIGSSDLDVGDVIWSPKSGTRSGFVRMNGRTIGSAASGATERANADTQDLYIFYWGEYSNTIAPVTGGRGASATADFEANKPIQLLNGRDAGLFGMSGMGNSSTGALSSLTFAQGDGTTPGSILGAPTVTITQANLPAITLTTTIAAGQGAHSHTKSGSQASRITGATGASGDSAGWTSSGSSNTDQQTLPEMTGTTPLGGGGAAIDKMPRVILGTFYQKL